MASKKKQPEGIALLSMYNDDDDEDMEPVADDHRQNEQEGGEFDEEPKTANGDGQEKTPSGIVQVLTPNVHTTSLSIEPLQTSQVDEMINPDVQLEAPGNEGTSTFPAKNDGPLDKFLPPPPKETCPEELQRKIDKFIGLKKIGRSFNAEVRNRKDYRNPDFLQHAVRYQEVDEIGSCFSKEVFDPRGYDLSDFYIEIEVDMRREKDRKEQEVKKIPTVDFISGGTQPGQVIPSSKFSLPIPAAADGVGRDGRQNKKSKWDKL